MYYIRYRYINEAQSFISEKSIYRTGSADVAVRKQEVLPYYAHRNDPHNTGRTNQNVTESRTP